jgi:hypothetical protein
MCMYISGNTKGEAGNTKGEAGNTKGEAGNTKGESITVPLTSFLTGNQLYENSHFLF